MVLPRTPQRGHPAQAAPTEVSYPAYSPTPSSIDATRHRARRIEQWTNQVPQSPGMSVGAKSAVWSDDLDTVTEESSGRADAQSREYLKPPSSNGHGHAWPQNSSAPSLRRQPPVPLLAQTPYYFPQPELSRGEHLSRSPSFHPTAPAGSVREARDKYLSQALKLPLDMLTEVAAPNEIYQPEPLSKPGRVGTILSRARSTVSLKGAAAVEPSHPAAASLSSMHDRPHILHHSPSKAYTRRHSQQSLRSVPEMHILPKLVANARAPHAGRGPEARPVAAQSPAPSYEDSKCSSMQTSESGHSFVKADPLPTIPQSQSNAYLGYTAEHSVNPTGVANKGASIQPASVFGTSPLNQDPIPTTHLARRTTSRGHHHAPGPAAQPRTGGQVEEFSSSPERTRLRSVRTDQRPPLTKSASVDGQMYRTRRVNRASSSASERTASDHGVVFTPSSVSIDNIHDNGERIAFEVPNRRGKLHVSLAWLPGRGRGAQSQPAHGLRATDRRASLQVPSHPLQPPSHRRSFSASEGSSYTHPHRSPPHSPHAPAPHGAPPAGVPDGHFMPGTIPFQAPGYGLHAGGHVPQPMTGARPAMGPQPPMSPHPPMSPQMVPGAPLFGAAQVPQSGYPMQPGYGYPAMQARPGMPMGAWPGHGQVPPMQPAPPGHPAPAPRRADTGRGPNPRREQRPARAATFPAPSTGSPWRKLWPFGKNTHNDTFLNRPAVPPKTARFAEPMVTDHKSQKATDRQRRAQRRDERAKHKSGSGGKTQGESGKKAN
ncbi:hypothetical protein CspHIS471_0510180 [Cutaneotrichosporon sp. HIS471]|nr:hypothetical protein CspHIS471_0510180 [Cutaneotrichosporon sp. HIS471]